MKNDRRLIISFIANILVFLLFVTGTIIMFTIGSGVKFIKVKGHADNEYNNRCDALARAEIVKLHVDPA